MLRMITSDWGAISVSASRVHSAACRLHSWASAIVKILPPIHQAERGGEESFPLRERFQANDSLWLTSARFASGGLLNRYGSHTSKGARSQGEELWGKDLKCERPLKSGLNNAGVTDTIESQRCYVSLLSSRND
jgi:hypothetical protein